MVIRSVLLIGHDLTECSAVNKELANKIFFYENILSKLPTNVYWKDKNSVYMGCNERLANVMGLPSTDAVKGMTDFDFSWNKEAAESFIAFDKQVMESGIPLTTEDVFEEANGEMVTVLTNKTPLINQSGETIGVLAISVDITELKYTQQELEVAKHKAEAASKSKSEFIANMSHDLRTPITGILGMAQDMINAADEAASSVQSYDDKNNAELLHDMITTVQRDGHYLMSATDELLALCNEILEVVRLESGKPLDNEASFCLNDVIEHNIELLNPVAQHKKLQLTYEMDAKIPEYFRGSRVYLDRILLNLMSNALKFTEEGSVKVFVECLDNLNSNYQVGDPINLKMSVTDTGIGIPKDKFDTIFEHFSRLTPSYEGLYKGAGLGLYTVKRYIEAMQGQVHIESKEGEGSSFIVTLPFTVSGHSDQKKAPIRVLKIAEPILEKAERREQPSASILVVEDNKLAALAVQASLKPFHCAIDFAHTGEEAIQMAQQGDYDLILMDIGLPDLNGLDVAKVIRAFSDPKKSRVPIVALTGHAGDADKRQAALDAGMQDVLSKPAQPLALETVLQHYVFGVPETSTPTPAAESFESEPQAVIDWEGCVHMCGGNTDTARHLLSVLADELTSTQEKLIEAYAAEDARALREELHRARGGVCYLRLPQLDHTLKAFHEAIKSEPKNAEEWERTYQAVLKAMAAFWKALQSNAF